MLAITCAAGALQRKRAIRQPDDIFFIPLTPIALDGEITLLFPETGFSDAAERRT
ncbi:hypothetical protein [Pseudomonas chlororaphis]|uniref:hypothetical protein n=1 Tax=Pseudomonas chlororaphis TaxID=587753 RepID=UPI000AAF3068|nr:hypothetical protein [Pseudomonas chlororaphis]